MSTFPAQPQPEKRKLKLSEAHFERQVRDYLEKVEGWRCFHFEEVWSEERKKTFGEPGMPDLLCIRYSIPWDKDWPAARWSDVMWIEMKRPKAKAQAHQKLWHIRERKCGALTLIAGEDFEATYDGFMEWYRTSGLALRVKGAVQNGGQ